MNLLRLIGGLIMNRNHKKIKNKPKNFDQKTQKRLKTLILELEAILLLSCR
jgi:hypothetical protein